MTAAPHWEREAGDDFTPVYPPTHLCAAFAAVGLAQLEQHLAHTRTNPTKGETTCPTTQA